MAYEHRAILIGGTSHTGKSTVSRALAERFGWIYRPTDKMARHPGRPWQTAPAQVPAHVADHYRSLPVDELIADVLRHYTDNVWPQVAHLVALHTTDLATDRLIVEGSAVLPELAVTVIHRNVAAVWLTADDEHLQRRIHTESRYARKTSREKELIDKFVARTCAFNQRTIQVVKRLGLADVDVRDASNSDELRDLCLSALEKQGCRLRN
jgi:2-phosphoglycerate kinase